MQSNSIGQSSAVSERRFRDGNDVLPANWSQVTGSAMLKTLRAIRDETKANYDNLRTWTATSVVHSREYLPQNYVATNLASSVEKPTELRQEFDYVLKFAIDLRNDSFYWDKSTRHMNFYLPGSNEPLKMNNVKPADGRYIATPEHFVAFSSTEVWPSFSMLPNHPQAQNKRAAFRRSLEFRETRVADLLDPRDFFGLSPYQTFWEMLDSYCTTLIGEAGSTKATEMERRLTVHMANRPQGAWYRIGLQLNAPNGNGTLYSSSVWSPLVGHHPVKYVITNDREGKQILSVVKWEWKQTGGIYVPTIYESSTWSDAENRQQSLRNVILKDCAVNTRLAENQFTYTGLGLKDGDLIVDKIEGVVQIIKDRRPQKLAAFGDHYVPSLNARDLVSSRTFWITGTLVLIVVLLLLIWRQNAAAS